MRFKNLILILMIILLSIYVSPNSGEIISSEDNITYTYTSKTVCNNNICYSEIYGYLANYHNGTDWNEIDQNIKNYENESIVIGGNIYKYGNTDNYYHAYFREKSSNIFRKPASIITQDFKYAITYDPTTYITIEPHKPTKNGRMASKQYSEAIFYNYTLEYKDQYKQINNPETFADLQFLYVNEYLKELYVIDDKQYVQDRFNLQVDPEDFNKTNIVFSTVIRAYYDSDSDGNTLGIFHGNDRINFKDYGGEVNDEIITNESIYFTNSNNETIYFIPELYAWDSNETQEDIINYTTNETIRKGTILLNKRISMTNFGNLKVEILVPFSWMNDSYRTYPIYVDPTTYTEYNYTDIRWNGHIRPVNTFPQTYENINNPVNNIQVGIVHRALVSPTYGFYRADIDWANMSVLPRSVKIINSSLYLYVTRLCTHPDGCSIGFHYMDGGNDSYGAGTGVGQGRNLFYNDMGDGDLYGKFIVTQYPAGSGYWIDLNENFTTELENKRYKNDYDNISIGMKQYPESTTADAVTSQLYGSRDNADVTKRPRLNITWRIDGCKPPFDSYWINNETCVYRNTTVNSSFDYFGQSNSTLIFINSTWNHTESLFFDKPTSNDVKLRLAGYENFTLWN